MSRAKIISNLQEMIDVNKPIIYINDFDFARVDEIIAGAVGKKNVFEWNPSTCTTNFLTKEPDKDDKEREKDTLDKFLIEKYVFPSSVQKFIVLKEIQDLIDSPTIKTTLALIAQRKLYDPDYEVTTIIVSSVLKVPIELEKYVSFLEIGVLGENDEDEIKRLIDEHVEVNGFTSFDEKDYEKLMPILKGMTPFEIDRILDMAMSKNGSLSAEDSEMILREKKQMVRKSGLLELIDTPDTQTLEATVGGLDALKDYLRRKADIVKRITEARKKGVSTPKGVFIVGMPGCGKSLCAKASASLFNAPLLKLDMGSMMGKYLGESEANLRKAIRIAEAAAPCVLWIDEIEKAFTGVGGLNSEVITRMFGYFLTWMLDKESCVYVIATANNADNLPPEFKRKGRFDEIFCVNLPNEKEREAIFKVHLKKKKCEGINLTGIITDTDGFNGADIESLVNETVEDCFVDNVSLTVEKLKEKAEQTLDISKSCKDQIDKMKKIFKESKFKDATTGKLTN